MIWGICGRTRCRRGGDSLTGCSLRSRSAWRGLRAVNFLDRDRDARRVQSDLASGEHFGNEINAIVAATVMDYLLAVGEEDQVVPDRRHFEVADEFSRQILRPRAWRQNL